MRFQMIVVAGWLLALVLARSSDSPPAAGDEALRLGNVSVSLAVKDIAQSRAFYEKLRFKGVFGGQKKNWLIL